MIISILFIVLLLLVIYLLLMPIILVIDSENNQYYIQLKGLLKVSVQPHPEALIRIQLAVFF